MIKNFSPKVVILSIGFRPNIGGLETHLTDLTNEIKKYYQTLVITLPPISTKINAKVVEKEGDLVIWRVPWFGKGLFYKFLKFPILEFFYLTPPLFVGLFIALLKHPSIQVVHVQGLSGIVAGGILSKLFGKRVIISVQYVFHFKKDFFGWFAKHMFNIADRILCVSLASQDEVRDLGISESKVGRCAYWIDLDIFKPTDKEVAKKKVGWSDNFSVFFIGRLVEEKGILPLLQAVPKLPKEVNLYIAGDGPLKDKIEDATKKYSNLHFLGKIDNSLTPLYYSAADIVVVPSYEETLGRVGMEALACETPVVASSAGGITEVVDESVGILIDKVDPKLIADAIIKLLRDNKLFKKLQRNCREHIKKLYSSRNVNVFIKEYGI